VNGKHGGHAQHKMKSGHPGKDHHRHMMADYRRRFFVSLSLTVPVLLFSPSIWEFLGRVPAYSFAGDQYMVFGLATGIYVYGGLPFLKGLYDEIKTRNIGMMTLIS